MHQQPQSSSNKGNPDQPVHQDHRDRLDLKEYPALQVKMEQWAQADHLVIPEVSELQDPAVLLDLQVLWEYQGFQAVMVKWARKGKPGPWEYQVRPVPQEPQVPQGRRDSRVQSAHPGIISK